LTTEATVVGLLGVVIEAALQAPDHTAGVVLVDGSQFAAAMASMLRDTFAIPDGYPNLIRRWFEETFTGSTSHAARTAGGRSSVRMTSATSAPYRSIEHSSAVPGLAPWPRRSIATV
jgi:hypothetical protein